MDPKLVSIGLPWWEATLLLGIAGAFGGLAAAMINREIPGYEQPKNMTAFARYCVRHCVLGACVAVGSLFLIIFLPILNALDVHAKKAFLVGNGILFGIFALRLLPVLEKDVLDRVTRKAEEAIATAQQAGRRSETAGIEAQRAGLIAKLTAHSTERALLGDLDEVIAQSEDYLSRYPRERTIAIMLANLLFHKKNNKERAITTMDRLIGAVRATADEPYGDPDRRDLGDALFNRICYLSNVPGFHEGETPQYEPTPEELTQCETALSDCFRITPENKIDASKDPDFKNIRNNPRFRRFFE